MTQAQAALFPAEPETTPQPKLHDERFDWYTAYCQERYARSPDWEIYHWAASGPRETPGCYVIVKGGIYKHQITKGKNKGRTDYKKPEPGSEATFSIVADDLDRFKIEWEGKTCKCHNCYGTGQEWAGWNYETGNRYRGCVRCSATGSSSRVGGALRQGERS